MAEEQSESGERTEEATAQRREDFRRRGQVAQTREMASTLILFGSAIALWALGKFFLKQLSEVFHQELTDYVVEAARTGSVFPAVRFAGEKAALIVLPMLLIFGVIGFSATVFQVGFIAKEDALELNFDLLNPVNGFQRLFSLKAGVEALKALIKLIIMSTVVFWVVKSHFVMTPYLVGASAEQILVQISSVSLKLLGVVGVSMVALSVLDYAFLRWDLERQMRMTKQEVKEEFKSREGDPQIKARIRKIQRDTAQKRMMENVPKADVIITNPTHIAVAIRYGSDVPAPQLVAKGADLIAEKIKSIAREHNIPIVENKPLARTIFKTMKLGQIIPRELYNAVAEVLAYVFKLKKKVLK